MNSMFRHRRELDEFESETKALATSGVCEGSCEKHTGATKALRTVGRDGTDWGWFSYCETAQEENRVMGFSLYEKTPCSSQLNQAQ